MVVFLVSQFPSKVTFIEKASHLFSITAAIFTCHWFNELFVIILFDVRNAVDGDCVQ